jgi:hypothetical protein
MITEKVTVLKADEGKLLTNGDTYGKVVYLGYNDSIDNWHEVDETELLEGGESDGK